MKTSETIGKISQALLQAQSSMGNASKGASNPFFKSSYADLNAIREVVTPALNANKISVLQPTTYIDGKAFVQTVLLHESGEYLSSLTEIVVAKANDPQAAGSAISYARRYGLQSFLSVGAVDDDGEKAMNRGPSPAQIKYEAKKPIEETRTVREVSEVKPLPVIPSVTPFEPVQVESAPTAPAKKKSMFQKPGTSSTSSSDGAWS
jgi:hypothetical protein